jgi:hypothetical protein
MTKGLDDTARVLAFGPIVNASGERYCRNGSALKFDEKA